MKILLITFTGTGNTFLCGEYIKEHFMSANHQVDHFVCEYNSTFSYDLNKFDLIGFGYPIHAFNAPQYFVKFIKKLPKAKIPFFIYKVSGEPFWLNNASSVKLIRILKRKGYTYLAEKHFLMPYNIIFRYKDSLAKQMYLYLKPLTKAFVMGIISNTPEKVRNNFFERFITIIFRIEWIAPKVNVLFLHSKRKKCNKCGLCIKNCPTHSLYMKKNGKIKSKTSCALCMRCSYNCPNNAMNMGILNLWVVNGPYKYKNLENDNSISPVFVHARTKGYFKLFRKYFKRQNALLNKYCIPLPITYSKDELL